MKWMAVAVLIWLGSPTAPTPVIQVAVESEALCREAVKALARDLGKIAANKSFGGLLTLLPGKPEYNLVMTSCVRIN